MRGASCNRFLVAPGKREESKSSDSGETNSPQTLWRGRMPRSSSMTRAPAAAAVMAADVPAGPAPMMIRSYMQPSMYLSG